MAPFLTYASAKERVSIRSRLLLATLLAFVYLEEYSNRSSPSSSVRIKKETKSSFILTIVASVRYSSNFFKSRALAAAFTMVFCIFISSLFFKIISFACLNLNRSILSCSLICSNLSFWILMLSLSSLLTAAIPFRLLILLKNMRANSDRRQVIL